MSGPLSFDALFLRDFWGLRFDHPDSVGTHRPLTTLSYWLDVHLGSGSWVLLHATNLVLFGALLVVAERFLRAWLGAALAPIARFGVIAAFAVMTIHVEVVASVTGRAEILAMLLSLIALDRAVRPRGSVVAIGLALGGAFLAKESALPMAAFAPILAFRRHERRVAVLVASVAPALALLAFRAGRLPFRMRGPTWEIGNPIVAMGPSGRALGVPEVLARYLEHTFAPIDLCPDYGYAAVVPTLSAHVAIGAMVLLGATIALARTYRSHPLVAETIVGGAASYVVVSHALVPGVVILADRNFFFPSFFVAVLAGFGLQAVARTRPRLARVVFAAGAFVVGVQALLTLLYVRAYRDNRTLSTYSARACPNAMRLHVFRGEHLHAYGAHAETAWSFLSAAAIFERFPRPLEDELVPGAWIDLPVDERVARLRTALGAERFLRARLLAIDALTRKRYDEARALVESWRP